MGDVKFTNGPWVREDTADYAEIWPASGERGRSAVALVGTAADADLIAAAPELFGMLSIAVDIIGRAGIMWIGEAKARAILAKARGDS